MPRPLVLTALACALVVGACTSDAADPGDAAATAPDGADAPDSPAPAYPLQPFPWLAEPPDTSVRLCAGAATPDDLDETTFIACALEGERFAAPDPPPGDALVVMAWNLERGFHVDAQAAALLDDPDVPVPDVLLVSEADRGCARTGGRHVARDLALALGMDYVFAVEFVELSRTAGPPPATVGTCEHGNALLSRYPLVNVRQLRHRDQVSWYYPPEGPKASHGEPRLGGRVAVVADLLIGGRPLRLYALHLESSGDPYVTDLQAAEVAADGLAAPIPAVAGGDLNAPFYWNDLARGLTTDPVVGAFLDRGWADAHAPLPAAERVTHPPLLVLDLVLATGVATSAPGICPEARCGGLSDHLPVWATVTLE